ncbi:MAG: ThuA domain-containing protein [Balneolaceae bacterium]
MIKSIFFAVSGFLALSLFTGCTGEESTAEGITDTDFSVLVFSKTAGFRHDSIEDGIEAVQKLGEEHNFSVTATEDSDYFTDENLSGYAAVVFLNTTMDVFDDEQQETFRNYVRNGGGFAGVHSAADTEYDWPWYGELVGAYFNSHPRVQEAAVLLQDGSHPATKNLSETWQKEDEWYNYKNMNEAVHVLLKLDTDSYEGSEHPGNHPISWYHEFDGGRAFYTGLGHTKESYTDPVYLDHLLGGIMYAAGIEE